MDRSNDFHGFLIYHYFTIHWGNNIVHLFVYSAINSSHQLDSNDNVWLQHLWSSVKKSSRLQLLLWFIDTFTQFWSFLAISEAVLFYTIIMRYWAIWEVVSENENFLEFWYLPTRMMMFNKNVSIGTKLLCIFCLGVKRYVTQTGMGIYRKVWQCVTQGRACPGFRYIMHAQFCMCDFIKRT